MNTTMYLIVAGVLLALGLGIGFILGKWFKLRRTHTTLAEATRKAKQLLADAEKEAESFRQGHLVQAKQEWEQQRNLPGALRS